MPDWLVNLLKKSDQVNKSEGERESCSSILVAMLIMLARCCLCVGSVVGAELIHKIRISLSPTRATYL